ncbi:helix-turn-helix transcriptional regulator [Nocardia cyriacigeorgica]|nr:helix-turn-helix transcriptional regulator [Nocardia cyriacigeorgica]
MTVFYKTRQRESAQVERAVLAQKEWKPSTATQPRFSRGRSDMSKSQHVRLDTTPDVHRHGNAVRAGYEAERRAVELGRAVRERREGLGLSQSELARRAGTSQAAISRLESGEHVPTLTLLDRLAAALDATVDVSFTSAA